ncbi:MAG: helix-turn-helix domain-containing protein [Oscillospiraceae bacterium]|nr:helix-turn-helix domain-containing protein [Oscillospiraceae bacterium]
MDNYVTGAMIRSQREKKMMTQEELAARIHVSGKAVSKWETGKGYPDISLIEPLAEALGISVLELLSGDAVQNTNRSANMTKSRLYVCHVCGNVIQTIGDAVISCCGITLPPQEAESPDEDHRIHIETVEDEFYVTVDHPMSKDHYISFIFAMSDLGSQFVKLYPQGSAEARFKISRVRYICAFCNRHGLFRVSVPAGR